jgi:hypothetical protein
MPESLRVAQKESQRLAVEPREIHEIDRIDAAFAGLTFRDEGLGSMKRLRDLDLGQAGVRSRFPKPSKHRFASRLVYPSNISH